MSDYYGNMTITIPLAQRETGKRISRALDADIGGYEAFSRFLDAAMQPCEEADAVYTTYSSPCSLEFAASMPYLLANPEVLQGMVAADYAARWPDLKVPTVVEIAALCKAVILPAEPVIESQPA